MQISDMIDIFRDTVDVLEIRDKLDMLALLAYVGKRVNLVCVCLLAS